MSVFEVVLTGLVYVFAILALIIVLLAGMTLVLRRKTKVSKVTGVTLIGPDNAGVTGNDPEGADGNAAKGNEDAQIAAVIAAAVAAYEADSGGSKFKVLSFRRVGRAR